MHCRNVKLPSCACRVLQLPLGWKLHLGREILLLNALQEATNESSDDVKDSRYLPKVYVDSVRYPGHRLEKGR